MRSLVQRRDGEGFRKGLEDDLGHNAIRVSDLWGGGGSGGEEKGEEEGGKFAETHVCKYQVKRLVEEFAVGLIL